MPLIFTINWESHINGPMAASEGEQIIIPAPWLRFAEPIYQIVVSIANFTGDRFAT